MTALFSELIERKVNLVSLKDGLDLSTSSGRLMANVLASVAQFETEVRAERVRAGQENAKAQGKHLGRPKGTGTRIKTTDHSAGIARELRKKGESVIAIAKSLNVSRQTVYALLKKTATA